MTWTEFWLNHFVERYRTLFLSVSLCDQLVAVSSFSQVYDPSALTIMEYGQKGSALLWNFDAYCFFQQGSVVNWRWGAGNSERLFQYFYYLVCFILWAFISHCNIRMWGLNHFTINKEQKVGAVEPKYESHFLKEHRGSRGRQILKI